MIPRILRQLLLPAAVTLLVAGCSKPGVSTVKGKVLYNGEPLSGADLEFMPEKDLTLGAFGGHTDAEGRFEIKIGKGTGMNARPGRFVVLITKGKAIGVPTPDANMPEEERVKVLMLIGPGGPGSAPGAHGILPARYASASTTPFKVDVSEGANDLNPFQMEGPPLKKR
jgi:hypothetical protein